MKRGVAVSIVSHGHGSMVLRLVESLIKFPEVSKIIVTLNIPEKIEFPNTQRLIILKNIEPKGFSSNHNAAFQNCEEEFFCSINPDVEFNDNPFPALLFAIRDLRVAIAAPKIIAPNGNHEDSWRRFPSFFSLVLKLFGVDIGRYYTPIQNEQFSPEWVAGMFMLFRSQIFCRLGGFDEKFFLYYEDVDIGVRIWKNGYMILACPAVIVIHDARRDSHRNWHHFYWHICSMVRYFIKYWGRLPKCSTH
jgi:N-acetylglucosaminyl-diphospho-decaprenol L-rhamnosyltransferase